MPCPAVSTDKKKHTFNTRKSNNFATKKKHASGIFMDLSKAIDSVKHFTLIEKLQTCGVTENLLSGLAPTFLTGVNM